MKYSEQYDGNFIEAITLPRDKPVELTIKSIEPANTRKVLKGLIDKPIVLFEESPKELVLNKTNGRMICKLYGNNMDSWIGKKVKIFQARVSAFGEKDVPAVRIWMGK